MTTTNTEDIISAVKVAVSDLQSDADSYISKLETAAKSYLIPDISQAAFDRMPPTEIVNIRDAGEDDPFVFPTPAVAPLPSSVVGGVQSTVGGGFPSTAPRVVGFPVDEDLPVLERSAWTLNPPEDIGPSDIADISDGPVFGTQTLVFNPEDYINSATLEKYSYTSAFFDNFLEGDLVSFIASESLFVAESVQDELFLQARDRDTLSFNDVSAELARSADNRGFSTPASLGQAAANEIANTLNDLRSGREDDITAITAENAHTNRKHGIKAGIGMEDIRSRFQLGFSKMYVQSMEFIVGKYSADVRAELDRVDGELALIKLKAKLDTANTANTLDIQGLSSEKEIDLLSAAMEEYRNDAKFEKIVTSIDSQLASADLEIAGVDSEMQATIVNSYLEKYKQDGNVGIANSKLAATRAEFEMTFTELDQEQQIARLGSVVEEIKEKLAAWETNYSMQLGAAKAVVDFYADTALGWASQINAVDYIDHT